MIAAQTEFKPTTPLNPALVEIEEAVLGGLMFASDELLTSEVESLPAAAFQISSHRHIFLTILEIHKAGKLPDANMVVLELAKLGKLQEVGGKAKIAQLLDRTVCVALVPGYVQTLKEEYQRQHFAESLERVARRSQELDRDAALALAKKELERLGQINNGNPTPETLSDLRDRIKAKLSSCHSYADYKIIVAELVKETGLNSRQIQDAVDTLQLHSEWEEERDDRLIDLAYLTNLNHNRLDLSRVLHPNLAKPLDQIARWMGIDPEALLTVLLPTAASLLHSQTRMVVKTCMDFVEPLVIYSAISTESGNRKSPLMKVIFKPLWELQREADEQYNEASQTWKEEYSAWQQDKSKDKGDPPEPPAPPREYFLQDFTIEALDKIKGEQPNDGRLISMDELSALFGGFGQYKGGKGTDKEKILSGWNGSFVKKNRASGTRVSITHDATSVTGGIQPDKLKQLMGNLDDAQGEWGRFLIYNFPLRPHKLPETDTKFEMFDLLLGLYRWLDKLPPLRYKFAPDAQKVYDSYYWELDQRIHREPRQGVRASLSKMKGYAARLSCELYILSCFFSQTQPDITVPKEFAEAGVLLTEFYIGQQALVYSDGEADQGELTPILSKILWKAQQLGQLSTRLAKQSVKALRGFNSPKILDFFHELAAMGLGVVKGKVFVLNGADGTTPHPTPPTGVTQNVDPVDQMLTEMLTGEENAESIVNASSQTSLNKNVDRVDHVDRSTEANFQPTEDVIYRGQHGQQVNISAESTGNSGFEDVDRGATIGSTFETAESTPIISDDDSWTEDVNASGVASGVIGLEVVTPDMVTPGTLVTPDAASTNVPAGVEFAAAPNNDVPNDADATSPDAVSADSRRMPAPAELASQLLGCDSWQKVLDRIDAIASAVGKSRTAVFNQLKRHISGVLRGHLLQLLSEHIRWYKNDIAAWNWLSKCGRRFKDEAFRLAQAT